MGPDKFVIRPLKDCGDITTEELRKEEQKFMDELKPQLNVLNAVASQDRYNERRRMKYAKDPNYKAKCDEISNRYREEHKTELAEKRHTIYATEEGRTRLLANSKRWRDSSGYSRRRTKCPQCDLDISLKSLKRHIQRKHATSLTSSSSNHEPICANNDLQS
jgi:hypothetical protein